MLKYLEQKIFMITQNAARIKHSMSVSKDFEGERFPAAQCVKYFIQKF